VQAPSSGSDDSNPFSFATGSSSDGVTVGCDAPFRALCLRHGATATYTEVLYCDRIVNDPTYLDAYLPMYDQLLEQSILPYNPLVVQICGNDPVVMSQAVVMLAQSGRPMAAIDLNLGCPQDRARDGLFGSFLLDKHHWERVFSCVQASSAALLPFAIPFFCKIRLVEGADIIQLTLQFCRYYPFIFHNTFRVWLVTASFLHVTDTYIEVS
jgi:tRNA-dihydrouridine synthase